MRYPHDIFISYAHQSAATAELFRARFVRCGWDVFIDQSIRTGARWEEVVEEALHNSRVVFVLWDNHSVESEWVRREARNALQQKGQVLFQLRLTDCSIPPEFAKIQAMDMRRWFAAHNGAVPATLVQQLWDDYLCGCSATRSFFETTVPPTIPHNPHSIWGYLAPLKWADGSARGTIGMRFDDPEKSFSSLRIKDAKDRTTGRALFQTWQKQPLNTPDSVFRLTCFQAHGGHYHMQLRQEFPQWRPFKVRDALVGRWFDPQLGDFVPPQMLGFLKDFQVWRQ
jgi:hypothetical protein